MGTEALIFDAVRTPRGKGKASSGALAEVSPVELSAGVLRALRDRNKLDTQHINDVILGCVDPAKEQSANIARTAALIAGYSESVPGLQINRFCSSALDAVALGAQRIKSGEAGLIVAGGVEMMSRVGMGGSGMAPMTDPAIAIPLSMVPQGISADLIATRYGYSRTELDDYAIGSQRRATTAWDENRFSRGVVPVQDMNGLTILDRDECIRPETDMQSIASLIPAFEMMAKMAGFDSLVTQKYPDVAELTYLHHAGNSSQISDGASAVLIGDPASGQMADLKPRAKILSHTTIGLDPTLMLTGPADASLKALATAGLTVADVDLWEVNEAFSSIVLYFMQQAKVEYDRVNVNGGAIAMGHPLGATGAMILGTLVDELERADKTIGVATLCAASGMASAMVVERVGD